MDKIVTGIMWVSGVAWVLAVIATGGSLLIPTAIVAIGFYFTRPTCPFCKSRIKRGVAVCRYCHRPLAWPKG